MGGRWVAQGKGVGGAHRSWKLKRATPPAWGGNVRDRGRGKAKGKETVEEVVQEGSKKL